MKFYILYNLDEKPLYIEYDSDGDDMSEYNYEVKELDIHTCDCLSLIAELGWSPKDRIYAMARNDSDEIFEYIHTENKFQDCYWTVEKFIQRRMQDFFCRLDEAKQFLRHAFY